MFFLCLTGYGFVDFDSPAAAQKAVTALKSSGVQAQMAKVRNDLFFHLGNLWGPHDKFRFWWSV